MSKDENGLETRLCTMAKEMDKHELAELIRHCDDDRLVSLVEGMAPEDKAMFLFDALMDERAKRQEKTASAIIARNEPSASVARVPGLLVLPAELTEGEVTIYKLLHADPNLNFTSKRLEQETGIPVWTIRKVLDSLRGKGHAFTDGSGANTRHAATKEAAEKR